MGQHFFGRRFRVAISDNFNSDGAAEAALHTERLHETAASGIPVSARRQINPLGLVNACHRSLRYSYWRRETVALVAPGALPGRPAHFLVFGIRVDCGIDRLHDDERLEQ